MCEAWVELSRLGFAMRKTAGPASLLSGEHEPPPVQNIKTQHSEEYK